MRTTNVAARALALAALAVAAGGCGGGSSGGGTSPSSLYAGSHHFVGYSGQTGSPEVATGQWGTLLTDGVATVLKGRQTRNANGTIFGPDDVDPFAFDVDAARRLTWRNGAVPFARGGVSADGRAAVLATVQPGSNPAIFLTCRKAGSFSDASLSGLYHFVAILYSEITLLDVTNAGALTFDGAGSAAGTADANVGGAVNSGAAVSATYTVGATGNVQLTYQGLTFEGGVLDGGDLVILAGTNVVNNPPALFVLVRGATTASAATLAGAYHVVGLSASPGPATVPAWGAFTTTASADGAGMLTVNDAAFNVDGDLTTLSGGTFGYTVAADGRLDLATSEPTEGGVSPGGDFAILGGATGVGDAPIVLFLVR